MAKPGAEIDRSDLKRPSIRARSKPAKDDIMAELANYRRCGVVTDDEIWQCDGKDIENGLSGVEETSKKVKSGTAREESRPGPSCT